jgi:hypothetical protein
VRIVGTTFKHHQQGGDDVNNSEEAYIVSIGGADGSVLQWRLTDAHEEEAAFEVLDVNTAQ